MSEFDRYLIKLTQYISTEIYAKGEKITTKSTNGYAYALNLKSQLEYKVQIGEISRRTANRLNDIITGVVLAERASKKAGENR